MEPATPEQQAAYDACMRVAKVLQQGRYPTDAEWNQAYASVEALHDQPQPRGFVEGLMAALNAVKDSLHD
jgi:hypothetical protein